MVENRNGYNDSLKYFLGDIYPLMQRKDITDIEINARGEFVWIDGSNGREITDIKINRSNMDSFLHKIASIKNSIITQEQPTLSAILPEELFRCRLEATIPPRVERPGPSIVIRKPGNTFPITDYVNNEMRTTLIEHLKNKSNILICGSTSSGKTSFLNSILDELHTVTPDDRLIVLEDEHEVNCSFENHEFLFTVQEQGEGTVTMAENVKKSLRKNPDRIIVGEVRGVEAREVLTAWDTGHGGGLCTLHAGGAKQGFMRFFRMAGLAWDNPLDQMFVGEAVDLILFLSKGPDGRKVREAVNVKFNYAPECMRPEFTHIYPTPTKTKGTHENDI